MDISLYLGVLVPSIAAMFALTRMAPNTAQAVVKILVVSLFCYFIMYLAAYVALDQVNKAISSYINAPGGVRYQTDTGPIFSAIEQAFADQWVRQWVTLVWPIAIILPVIAAHVIANFVRREKTKVT